VSLDQPGGVVAVAERYPCASCATYHKQRDTVGEVSRSVATPPVIGKTELQSGGRTGLPGRHLWEQTANSEFANSVRSFVIRGAGGKRDMDGVRMTLSPEYCRDLLLLGRCLGPGVTPQGSMAIRSTMARRQRSRNGLNSGRTWLQNSRLPDSPEGMTVTDMQRSCRRPRLIHRQQRSAHVLTSGHSLSASGRNTSLPGVVDKIL
jgi:hypothetical protein